MTLQRNAVLRACLAVLALAPFAIAHEGHDHSGASLTQEGPPTIGAPIFLPKETQFLMDVRTVAVHEETLPATVSTLGRIVIPPSRKAEIRAPLPGLVLFREDLPMAQPGDRVDAGQVLALVEQTVDAPVTVSLSAEIASTQSALALAKEEVHHKNIEYERVQALGEAASERRLAESRAELNHARIRAEGLEQTLHELQAARSPDNANPRVASLKAPIAGVVARSTLTPGEFVGPERALLEIVNPDVVWVESDVYEHQLPLVDRATRATVRLDGYDNVFPATIHHFASMIDEASRTVNAVFEVQNPDHTLREGMFVNVFIETADTTTGVMAPVSAVVEQRGINLAYVKTGAETFVAREVRVAGTWGDRVMIEEGLLPGEVVVTQGIYQVRAAHTQAGAAQPKKESTLEHGHEH